MPKYNKKNQQAQPLTMHKLVELIAHKTNFTAQKRNNGFIVRCPVHGDQVPSVSVSEGNDGRILIHCFKGCEFKDICHALEIEAKDLFPRKRDK